MVKICLDFLYEGKEGKNNEAGEWQNVVEPGGSNLWDVKDEQEKYADDVIPDVQPAPDNTL